MKSMEMLSNDIFLWLQTKKNNLIRCAQGESQSRLKDCMPMLILVIPAPLMFQGYRRSHPVDAVQ
jgi:hypothetical protein